MKEKFVGTWRLLSWNQQIDGQETPYFGPNPDGRLVYTAEGRVSAHVSGSDRPRMGMPPEEARHLAMNLVKPWKARAGVDGLRAILNYFRSTLSYVAYAGTYSIDGDEVVHHVEVSLIADWIGTEQRRRFRFEANGDRLVLVAPPEGRNPEHVLTWARL